MLSTPTPVSQKRRHVLNETMKAVRIHAYGGPEVLQYEKVLRPTPGAGEVLVRVYAAGVNPIDWKIRQGYVESMVPHSFPLTLGLDFAGVVETVGPGVIYWKKGDAVFSRQDPSCDGTYAEYVVVKALDLAAKPASLDAIRSAAVPLAGLTAWQALFDIGALADGQSVLIHAAAGGVGSFAVQLAKWKGARVIGTASSRHLQHVKSLGADKVIDYQTQRFEEIVHDVDLVLDTIGGDTQRRSWPVIKKGGTLVSTVQPPAEQEAAAHGARGVVMAVQTKPGELEQIAKLIDSGKLRVYVETVLPLSEARQAHLLSQTNHTCGKIVLKVA